MKNRTLLETRVRLVMPDEAQEAIDENKELLSDLYKKEKGGCSLRTAFFTVVALVNIGLYFLLKNVSPGYMVPKMILGNIFGVILIYFGVFLIINMVIRRKRRNAEKADDDDYDDDWLESNDGKYVIVKNLRDFKSPKLTLREHDFTYGGGTYEWTEIIGYTNSDEWLFTMIDDESIVPIKIDNLKEKRRMEIIGIFADRIRRAKITKQSDDEQ